MSERSKHLFEFSAEKIAEAAKAEAVYHQQRVTFWQEEHRKAKARVKDLVRIEWKEYPITGGSRLSLEIVYEDPGAYQRLQESWDKIKLHRTAAEAFATDAEVYDSQSGRPYLLDAADVLHYRLGGGPRQE